MSNTNMTDPAVVGKSAADLEAEAFEHDASAATLRARAVRARAVEQRQQRAPSIAKAVHMTRSEYAHRSRVSDATVSRWVKDGMPVLPVGTTDRIDPIAADEWRRTRPRKATTQKKNTTPDDDLDVSACIKSAGIRRIERNG